MPTLAEITAQTPVLVNGGLNIVALPMDNTVPWFTFQTTLSQTVYTFRMRFNVRMNRWVMDLADAQNNDLINGIPLLVGQNLLGQYVAAINQISTTGSYVAGSTTMTVTSTTGVASGQPVASSAAGIPSDAVVAAVATSTITLSEPATASATNATVTFTETTDLPPGILFVIDNTGNGNQPTLGSFGTTHTLFYYDPTGTT